MQQSESTGCDGWFNIIMCLIYLLAGLFHFAVETTKWKIRLIVGWASEIILLRDKKKCLFVSDCVTAIASKNATIDFNEMLNTRSSAQNPGLLKKNL